MTTNKTHCYNVRCKINVREKQESRMAHRESLATFGHTRHRKKKNKNKNKRKTMKTGPTRKGMNPCASECYAVPYKTTSKKVAHDDVHKHILEF